jgi:DNA-directed RNA polymerase subunit RPC12/RpoP
MMELEVQKRQRQRRENEAMELEVQKRQRQRREAEANPLVMYSPQRDPGSAAAKVPGRQFRCAHCQKEFVEREYGDLDRGPLKCPHCSGQNVAHDSTHHVDTPGDSDLPLESDGLGLESDDEDLDGDSYIYLDD